MAINTNAQNVIIGDSLVDYCTYQESASRYAIPGKNHMGQPMMIPIGEHILSRHMLLLGGIGTGKSNAFNHIIRNTRSNLTNEDVMIIFDTKGDFYKEFYRPGDVVISNDARATGGSEADYWNIFEEVTIDDRVEENILEIAKGLFAEKLEHTTQPFFPNAAKDLFAALMLHLVRNDKFADKRNNKSLRSYLNSITPHIMVDILNQHSDLKAMQSYIYDEKSGQTLGVMAELQQMMREIFIGNFQKKGGLSMRKLVRRKGGRVIFVEYDLGIGGMLMPIYRLLIDLAIKEALCRTSNEGNVYFFIDEFRLVPHLEHIDDGVNFGRSLGAKFFVGIQNIDQVMAAYGEYTGRSILSGFGTTFAFRVSVTTRRMIFQAEGGTFFRSRISKEISLDKVTGVDCYYGVNMKITQIIVGVILTILGFYAWGISSSYIGSGRFYSFLIMILGIVLIVSGIRKSFKLTIYASECSPSPINIGEGALSLQGNAVFYAIVSEPTSDTDRMMNEVGALVHDLQTMGDMAVSKWKN